MSERLDNCNYWDSKVVFGLFLVILGLGAFLRLYGLSHQGFSDTDEFAAYQFLSRDLPQYRLEGVAGSMWGRPIGYWLCYLWMNLFGSTPFTLAIFCSIAGIAQIIIMYHIGERFFGKWSGLVAATLTATLFPMVFYSRNMKFVSVSWFFCALSILFIFSSLKKLTAWQFVFSGLAIAAMVASHPNTLPMAACMFLVLAIGMIIVLWKDGGGFRLFSKACLAPFVFFLVLGICEISFIVIKKYLPFFEVVGNVGYLTNLIYHSNLSKHSEPSFHFYLSSLAISAGSWLLWMLMGSTFITLFNKSSRWAAFSLFTLFLGPIAFFVFTEMVAVARSAYVNIIPASLLIGAGFSQLQAQFGTRFGKKIENLSGILIISVLATCATYISAICLNKVSAAQQLYNYVGTGTASFSAPSTSVYYWSEYYFKDRRLYVNNWNEVFRNFLSRRGEFLVNLDPSSTKADELLNNRYEPSRVFNNLHDNRMELPHTSYNLYEKLKIFSDLYGFDRVASVPISNPAKIDIQSLEVLNGDLKNPGLHLDFENSYSSNLLMIGGKIALQDPDTLLAVGLGDKEHPLKYSLEIFQPNSNLSSFHKTWKLDANQPKDLRLSFWIVSKDLKLIGTSSSIQDFRVDFFSLPQKHIFLAAESRILKGNKAAEKRREKSLIFYARQHLKPPDALKLNGSKQRIFHILPKKIVPNAVYRVRFRAKTVWGAVGRVVITPGTSNRQIGQSEYFWQPWWRVNEFEFRTPVKPVGLSIYLENIRPNNLGSEVLFEEFDLELKEKIKN